MMWFAPRIPPLEIDVKRKSDPAQRAPGVLGNTIRSLFSSIFSGCPSTVSGRKGFPSRFCNGTDISG
jgi:hypothetical protein